MIVIVNISFLDLANIYDYFSWQKSSQMITALISIIKKGICEGYHWSLRSLWGLKWKGMERGNTTHTIKQKLRKNKNNS